MGDVSYSTEGGGKSKNLYCIHGLDHEVWLQKQVVFFRAATVVAIWILCWVCVMGIPCWSAQVSLVEAVEAQQVRLQVTSTTAASHIPAPRSSKKKPHLLVPLAFAPSFSGNVSI